MGREIRRVPMDWEHPKDERGYFIPLYDKSYREAAERWMAEYDLWKKEEHPNQPSVYCKYFWEHESPPDPDTCREREWAEAEATGYQIYETVSEGTPKSPVFANLDDMVVWLVSKGYSPSAAVAFANNGWAPSMTVKMSNEGAIIKQDIEALDD